MIVPTTVFFQTVPVGGVYSGNTGDYFIKTDASSGINLGSGAASTGIVPGSAVYYWPNASLSLG